MAPIAIILLVLFFLTFLVTIGIKKANPYDIVLNLWTSKNNGVNPQFPIVCFHRAGNVWEIFNSREDYFGVRNHFLFEDLTNNDAEYLIDKTGNFFIIKFDNTAKVRYPELIKKISLGEILDLVRDSEINELKMYENLESVDRIIENLLMNKFSY